MKKFYYKSKKTTYGSNNKKLEYLNQEPKEHAELTDYLTNILLLWSELGLDCKDLESIILPLNTHQKKYAKNRLTGTMQTHMMYFAGLCRNLRSTPNSTILRAITNQEVKYVNVILKLMCEEEIELVSKPVTVSKHPLLR